MYIKRNIEARTWNHCCSGSSIIITYCKPVFVAHAPYCHLWSAPLYNIFPLYLTNDTILEKKVTENKMCLDFLYNFCLKYFSFQEEFNKIRPKSYTCRSACKAQLLLSYLITLKFSGQVFEKYTHIESDEDPFCGSRVVPAGGEKDGQTDGRTDGRTNRRTDGPTEGRTDGPTDGRTDMMKLIVAFRNFANMP